jgi:hypothetical protein
VREVYPYLFGLLKEPSTWRALIILLTLCGIVVSPEEGEKIIVGGVALVGVLGAAINSKKKNSAAN